MRKIRFRAWDRNDGKMKICYNIHFKSNGEIIGSDLIMWEGAFSPPLRNSSVIMQYTGLKDKNGKEIYEGDIITASNNTELYEILHGEFIRTVFNQNDIDIKMYGYYCKNLDKTSTTKILPLMNMFINIDKSYQEVIDTRLVRIVGNIYENPELLDSSDKNV